MFDLATKYTFHLDKNTEKSMELYLLLSTFERYVNGAIIEMKRLDKIRENIAKEFALLRSGKFGNRSRNNFNLTYLACDTHFFFLCIDKCHKLIEQLAIELNDPDIKKLKIKLDAIFDISTIRNHLEHIEQRCIGYQNLPDEQKKIKKPIYDFGNFIGDSFSFNNKKFPSNKKSLEELKQIYKDLIKILHNKYAIKDPQFFQNLERDKRLKIIQKTLKKAWLV